MHERTPLTPTPAMGQAMQRETASSGWGGGRSSTVAASASGPCSATPSAATAGGVLDGLASRLDPGGILASLSWHVRRELDRLGDALNLTLRETERRLLDDLLTEDDAINRHIGNFDRHIDEALAPYAGQRRLQLGEGGGRRRDGRGGACFLGRPAVRVNPDAPTIDDRHRGHSAKACRRRGYR